MRNANAPVMRRVGFAFENLPESFDGFRILHLSDFHFDDRRPELPEIVCSLVRGVEADLCVLTGDFRFNLAAPMDPVYRGVEAVVSALQVRRGVLAVLGNNDTSDLLPAFEQMGIRLLLNEHCELAAGGSSIRIAGVDDPHDFRCHSLAAAFEGVPADAFTILLVHSPEIVAEAAARGVDLYLCGHTHGGQMRVPRLGPIYLNARCSRTYAAGPWRCGTMQGYTTTGLGTSTVPVRYACPPEAALIELRRGDGPEKGPT